MPGSIPGAISRIAGQRWIRFAGATVLAFGLTAPMASPAHADPYYDVEYDVDKPTSGRGLSVNIWLKHDGVTHYFLWFNADGEVLNLRDWNVDGDKAEAWAETVVPNDLDHFVTGPEKWYNLGTPDGSGDIDEGVRIRFKLCRKDFKCSGWVYGTA